MVPSLPIADPMWSGGGLAKPTPIGFHHTTASNLSQKVLWSGGSTSSQSGARSHSVRSLVLGGLATSVPTRYEQFAQRRCPRILVDQDLGTEGKYCWQSLHLVCFWRRVGFFPTYRCCTWGYLLSPCKSTLYPTLSIVWIVQARVFQIYCILFPLDLWEGACHRGPFALAISNVYICVHLGIPATHVFMGLGSVNSPSSHNCCCIVGFCSLNWSELVIVMTFWYIFWNGLSFFEFFKLLFSLGIDHDPHVLYVHMT